MTDQLPPTATTYSAHQMTALTEQLTTKRIVFDASGEPFWLPPFRSGGGNADGEITYETGQRVSFHLDGATRTGTIDMVMPDGTLLWVWLDGGGGRRLLPTGNTTLALLGPESKNTK